MRLFAPACLAVLLFAACSTDFTLEAPYKDIPVIYGFLNVADTAHYIRVEKAFLEEGGDANRIAQLADSLYYDPASIRVTLEKNDNGQLIEMRQVDGNVEGYVREEGVFASAPNYLYKLSANELNLQGGQSVKIRVERDDVATPEGTAMAETVALSPIEPRSTSPPDDLRFADYDIGTNVRFTAGEEAKVFSIAFLITIQEEPMIGGPVTERTLRWQIATNQSSEEGQSVVVRGDAFYQFLNGNLEADGMLRTLQEITIEYAGGGQEIADYLRIANANIGITSSQNIPVYTNVENGRGIFTSRYITYRTGLFLNSPSRDSLRNGIYTKNLGFR